MSSPCPPGNLIEPAELAQFGVPAVFLRPLVPVPIDVKITNPGALGAMQLTWRRTGEPSWSPTVIPSSENVTEWTYGLDVLFASLTFAAGIYDYGTEATIDESGTVSGTILGLTATRYDRRLIECSAVTAEALMLMQNAIKRPLKVWTDDAKRHAAAMVYANLKSGVGSTTNEPGDEIVYRAAADGRAFFIMLGERGKPDGWEDSSASDDGPIFSAYPTSAQPARGW